MRILIADQLSAQVPTGLRELRCDVIVDSTLSGDALRDKISDLDPQVLVVRSTKVQEQHLRAASSLSLVIRAGAGVNTIDVDTASRSGIYIANCPGKNAVAVAELTWGHIINADRRIADNVSALREGQWLKKSFAKECRGLKSRVLGIVGAGSIGREVAQRGHAFGMHILGWDPFVTDQEMSAHGIHKQDSLIEMSRQVDVLSVHLPLNDSTRGIIDHGVLGALPAHAIFVNTSRGPVVDEEALGQAIKEKQLRVGLDVFCQEPSDDGAWEQALVAHDTVYGTHHIGASTEQASEAVGDEVLRIVAALIQTGSVPNCVNLAQQRHASALLVVRHADAVGVLADVLDQLRRANINVQEMENIIFRGALAACARIQIDRAPDDSTLTEIQRSEHIFSVEVVALDS
jgi:D-3-phosphoglycerate dehydrogenase